MTRSIELASADVAGTVAPLRLTEYAVSVADVGLAGDLDRLIGYIVDSAMVLLPGISDAAVVLFPRSDFEGSRVAWADLNPAGAAGPVLDGRVDAPGPHRTGQGHSDGAVRVGLRWRLRSVASRLHGQQHQAPRRLCRPGGGPGAADARSGSWSRGVVALG